MLTEEVDTSQDCTRIIIDNWVDVRITNATVGEKILVVVHQLRLLWKNLLSKKLNEGTFASADLQVLYGSKEIVSSADGITTKPLNL
jgi:hypothetical protein